MLLVNDVTAAGSTQVTPVKVKSKTSITPFQKVLKKESEKVLAAAKNETAAPAQKTNEAEKSESVDKYTGSGGCAETTLKDIFERASEKYNISYDFLVAVAKAESDFNTKCVSSAGAKGIMQLMPDECKSLGVKDPYDAESNIMASARLLKAHLDKFDGNYTLAAAAYNAGSGAVKKYGGVPPYNETQNYVKKIRKFMQEGVNVPNRKVNVAETDSSVGSGGSTGKTENGTAKNQNVVKQSEEKEFDTGKQATEEDLENVTVAVGSGTGAVTMTYGAYLKYLELGTTGVG